jgi:hypothetical protein
VYIRNIIPFGARSPRRRSWAVWTVAKLIHQRGGRGFLCLYLA